MINDFSYFMLVLYSIGPLLSFLWDFFVYHGWKVILSPTIHLNIFPFPNRRRFIVFQYNLVWMVYLSIFHFLWVYLLVSLFVRWFFIKRGAVTLTVLRLLTFIKFVLGQDVFLEGTFIEIGFLAIWVVTLKLIANVL